jgi:septal ring factor EnvC (AmiA/AmiB activator)
MPTRTFWQMKRMQELDEQGKEDLETADSQLRTLEEQILRCKTELMKSQGEMTVLRRQNASLTDQLKRAEEVSLQQAPGPRGRLPRSAGHASLSSYKVLRKAL